MARHKDINWNLPEGRLNTWELVFCALLMDIRDELKSLNAVFGCVNFLRIQHDLNAIRLNTQRKRKRKRKS